MSKLYYNPIELPELSKEKQSAEPEIDNWPTREQFGIINDRIAKEMDRIQAGTSELTHYPQYFNVKEPVMQAFVKFKEDSNKKNWTTFMIIAEQDLGIRAVRQFEAWYALVFTGTVSYKEE